MLDTDNPLVSIIIPCYNYGEYVEEAIASASQQTYPNIEIIVINDGSTDDSAEKIRKIAQQYDLTFIDKENEGIVPTRNAGISAAQGQWIVQLDADDWLDPDYVEKTLDACRKNRVDIGYTQAKIFGRVEFETQHPEFDRESLKHNNYIHCSSLIRKSLFADRQYDLVLNNMGNEDWDFYLGACLDGAKAVLVHDTFLHYRKHDNFKSREDVFASQFNHYFARHYILEKYMFAYPDQMSYFATEVNALSEMKRLVQENETLTLYRDRIESLKSKPVIKHVVMTIKKLKN